MKPQTNDRGRVKVRYMEIDVEGGSSAILEGLRTVTAAFSKDHVRIVNGAPQPRAIAPDVQAKPLAPKNGDLFDEVVAPEEAEGAAPSEAKVESEVEVSRTRQKRSYPNCKLVEGLDLEKGTPNLRVFAEAKRPESNNEKYMVCASWLRKELGIKALTNDHLYSCFTALEWKVPKDVGQPLRNMKNKQFVQNPAGDWELHSNGEQCVARLPQRD
ncbi:MAG: hypothetical protein Q8N23_34995 [Archangium sp.]|nr:hypothetical protein [Archangium sp.]MDP3157931.1 hypothetical protein [Archangium sp.]MDP3572119.1 hypothetical protein [Archangium sp.]